MKKFFYRIHECDHFFIPDELTEEFDNLVYNIDCANSDSDEWYDLNDQFTATFYQYRQEGNITRIPLFLDDETILNLFK